MFLHRNQKIVPFMYAVRDRTEKTLRWLHFLTTCSFRMKPLCTWHDNRAWSWLAPIEAPQKSLQSGAFASYESEKRRQTTNQVIATSCIYLGVSSHCDCTLEQKILILKKLPVNQSNSSVVQLQWHICSDTTLSSCVSPYQSNHTPLNDHHKILQ